MDAAVVTATGEHAGDGSTADLEFDSGGGDDAGMPGAPPTATPMVVDSGAPPDAANPPDRPTPANDDASDAATTDREKPEELLPGIVAQPQDDATFIYDPNELRTYELTVAPEDLASIDTDPRAEAYVPAQLLFQGESYSVAMRYKGSVGAFRPPCTNFSRRGSTARTGKCSIKVSFNEYDPEGRFFGLKKLQFHSMNRDPSMMRDRLAYHMFRQSGLAAPRSVHARLLINGQLAGLFALVEQIDGRFTRSRFTEGGKGNLYKEIWPLHDDPETYINALHTNEDEDPNVDAFLAFKDAIPLGSDALSRFIHWDTLLTFLAVDRVIVNDDGPLHFWCAAGGQGNNPDGEGNHNYYWYEGAAGGHFTLIPWDMDSSFVGHEYLVIRPEWREPAECTCTGTLVPASCDPLVQQFIGLNDRFEAHVDSFIEGPFAASNVEPLLNTWEAQISDAVAESAGIESAPSFEAWQASLADLRAIVATLRSNRGYPYDE